MLSLPQGATLRSTPLPPPPSGPPTSTPAVLSPVSGTIPYAKINGGTTELNGKIVSAVFEDENHELLFFYIQEADDSGYRPAGIKVYPPETMPCIDAGDVVNIQGSVDADAECHIDATSVTIVGQDSIPATVGMPNRSTAAGEFGLQPALYRSTTEVGTGLPTVGSRVRVWGEVTSRDGNAIYIDDGSNLTGDTYGGLRIIYYPGTTPEQGDYAIVTGVLGAEMNDDCAVPVVRVPPPGQRPEGCIIGVAGDWGDDSNDGSTWRCAKKTIQAAVNQAYEGCEIWVAAAPVQNGYEESVTVDEDMGLYGGFAGWEHSRDQRDPQAHETVIRADEDDNLVVGVEFEEGLTSAAVVDGFTIRDFTTSGVDCPSSSPTISNNRLTGNTTTGIHCTGEGQTPHIQNNTIDHNAPAYSESRGGALRSDDASPVITGNTFEANGNCAFGGAIYLEGGSATIDGNTFRNNTVQFFSWGGAIGAYQCTGTVLVHANVFEGNGGDGCERGGAIHMLSCEELTVTDNLFIGNHATGSEPGGGGAIHLTDTPASIVGNTFVQNWTGWGSYPPTEPRPAGGAVHIRSAPATFANNIFYGNISALGDSVACSGAVTVTISHCDAYPGTGGSNYYADSYSVLVWDLPEYANLFISPTFCGGQAHPYWLALDSDLRGQGDPAALPAGDTDLDGRVRPGDDGADIGAYEDNPECE